MSILRLSPVPASSRHPRASNPSMHPSDHPHSSSQTFPRPFRVPEPLPPRRETRRSPRATPTPAWAPDHRRQGRCSRSLVSWLFRCIFRGITKISTILLPLVSTTRPSVLFARVAVKTNTRWHFTPYFEARPCRRRRNDGPSCGDLARVFSSFIYPITDLDSRNHHPSCRCACIPSSSWLLIPSTATRATPLSTGSRTAARALICAKRPTTAAFKCCPRYVDRLVSTRFTASSHLPTRSSRRTHPRPCTTVPRRMD